MSRLRHPSADRRVREPGRRSSDAPSPATIEAGDLALVARIESGDESAFEELFRRYYRDLYLFALGYVRSRDLAEEVVQEVFVRLWERRQRWSPSSSLKLYVYRAVRNEALNCLRSLRVREYEPLEVVDAAHGHLILEALTPIGMMQQTELVSAVAEAIDRLPERRRAAFLLHRIHGFTYEEIAATMEISPKTVANQISEALHYLLDAIAPYL